MGFFIARVELHNEKHDSSAYLSLHKSMENAGFGLTATDTLGSGGTVQLPPATYSMTINESIGEVRNRAIAAATAAGYPPWTTSSSATAKTSGILVDEGPQRWRGFKPA
jgi:hypothetical protein